MVEVDERFGSLLAKAATSKGPHASNSRQEQICLILILTCFIF